MTQTQALRHSAPDDDLDPVDTFLAGPAPSPPAHLAGPRLDLPSAPSVAQRPSYPFLPPSVQPRRDPANPPQHAQADLEGPGDALARAEGLAGRPLTSHERSLLLAVLEPDTFGLPWSRIAERAGVPRDTTYDIIHRPWFKTLRRELLDSFAGDIAPSLARAAYKSGLIPGRDGAIDRWKLLEAAGFGGKRVHVEHTGSVSLEARLARVDARMLAARQDAAQLDDPDLSSSATTVVDLDPVDEV